MTAKILKTVGIILFVSVLCMTLVPPGDIAKQFQAAGLWFFCGFFVREQWI